MTFDEALAWLHQEARRLIRACRCPMADGTAAFPPQVGLGYDAFWLRDYSYMLEACPDAFSDRELNVPRWKCASGALTGRQTGATGIPTRREDRALARRRPCRHTSADRDLRAWVPD